MLRMPQTSIHARMLRSHVAAAPTLQPRQPTRVSRASCASTTGRRAGSSIDPSSCMPSSIDPASPQDLQVLYSDALQLWSQEEYELAEEAFERLLQSFPHFCKGWVSYAQMWRRQGRVYTPTGFVKARGLLQRGCVLNPYSACILQAWGLHELQMGNLLGAVKLLERSVKLDPRNMPVLRWHVVQSAARTSGRDRCPISIR